MVQKHSTRISWDDLEAVLMVGRYGTVRRAAERMKLAHTTVAKKVASAESNLGLPLFVKTRKGYRPTEEGLATIEHAERMAAEADKLILDIEGADHTHSGVVRVSINASLLAYIAVGAISALRERHPGILMSFSTEDHLVDIGNREADVVLRMQNEPAEDLFGRRLCEVRSAVYARNDFEFPQNSQDKLPVAGWGETESVLRTYKDLAISDPYVATIVPDINVQVAIAREGLAAAELPCYVGDAHEDLVRISGPKTRLISDLWILTHESLSSNARIRAASDALVSVIAAKRNLIEGKNRP